MTSDWQVLGLDTDPTPGDPAAVHALATRLGRNATTADDGTRRLRAVAAGGGDLAMRGDYAASYTGAFDDLPGQLAKLARAYRDCGTALSAYATTLGRAKSQAGAALRQGLDAHTRYQGAIARVETMLPAERALLLWPNDELSPGSIAAATADLPGPNVADQVRVVARQGEDARHDRDLAARLARDAASLRDGAARTCAEGIDTALRDSGIKNRPWYLKAWDSTRHVVTEPFTSWHNFVGFCADVALVVGVAAMVVSGPAGWILGAVVLGASAVVLTDALRRYGRGQASLGEVLIDAVGVIPGGRGAAEGARGLGEAARAVRAGRGGSRIVTAALRLGRARPPLATLGRRLGTATPRGLEEAGRIRGPLRRAEVYAKAAWCRVTGRDPIDLASGQMILDQDDVELPGVLAWTLRRTYQSGYTAGRWFGAGWSSTVDLRLEVDHGGVCFAAADGVALAFPHPTPGDPPVLPEAGPRLELALDEAGRYTILDAAAGHSYLFAIPADGQRDVALPLAAVVDRNGNRIELGYDADGELAQISHSGGYQLTVRTDGHRIVAVAAATAEGEQTLVRYGYDATGQLTQVVNSSGRALRFDYDPDGRIVRWLDRNGTEYRYTYDATGRVVRTAGSDDYLAGTLAYDDERHVTTETNSLGHVTAHHFTDRLRPARHVDPLGRVTAFGWDRFDNRTEVTDPLGRTIRYRYDDIGNLVTVERPDGTQTTTTWNAQRRPLVSVDANGARWEREYDTRGNLAAVVDPTGGRTDLVHDDRGRLIALTDALGQLTQVETDAAGLPIAVIDPAGAVTSWDRDALGRVVATTDPLGGVTRLSWTPEGHLTSRGRPDGATDTYRYDPEGNLVEQVDPAGFTTRTEYTHFDLPTVRTSPDGSRMAFGYDTELRLTSVTNPQGLRWSYEYDAAGQLVAETDFDGRTIRYDYDAAGQLVGRTNGAGETVTFARDSGGDIVARSGPDGTSTFAYDATGRVVRATSPDAEVLVERDLLGRVTAEICDGRRLASRYDPLGHRTRRTTPSGAISSWEHDPAGRPLALRTAGQLLTFTHDAAGHELERHLVRDAPGGAEVVLTQRWDARDQLRSQALVVGPGPAGPGPAGLGQPAGAGTARLLQRRDFAYTSDGYLAETDDLLAGVHHFELDAMRRVTAVRGGAWAERYAYDPAGNLTHAAWPASVDPDTADEQGERGYDGTLIRQAGKTRYEHDAQGRIILRRQLRPAGETDDWRYTWDADDHLTAVTTPDGTVWQYRYDAFGRRIAKQRLSSAGDIVEQITFVWDGLVLAEQHHTVQAEPGETAGPSTTTVTTWDWEPNTFRPLTQSERRPTGDQASSANSRPDDPDQAWYDTQFHAIVTDLIGTPTELVDPDGRLAWHSRATLWGVSPPSTPTTTDCPLRFPGQYHDPETGLNYNFHRYYDPATARYKTSDALGLSPAPNPWTYVTNPLTWIDPFGLAPCKDLLHAFGNAQGPRAPRLGKDFDIGPDGMIIPQEPPEVKGASTFADVTKVPVRGIYHSIPADTPMPDGIGLIRDGRDAGGVHFPTHASIYPTKPMKPDDFVEKFLGLPWKRAGRKN
ncbi:DUF6531 domain-containing protein [Pseudofrankia inefficax]|uniref:YD repeat-containing protein n=1 Tax=Pseudofrankia inefficax (strain DSM 45817 / CECT 9037 / DDB 130130 / EuI1c) TaxID=298654 RepID=E3J3S7_PSEI1|nr:DUF6531 domain-containing protein [Pseudofrankia inefficax]ADP79414.1 YD repeat-containing protein [Pseudofrankia inefficax]